VKYAIAPLHEVGLAGTGKNVSFPYPYPIITRSIKPGLVWPDDVCTVLSLLYNSAPYGQTIEGEHGPSKGALFRLLDPLVGELLWGPAVYTVALLSGRTP